MPIVWDVEPYRTLTEMRENYTRALYLAGRNVARKIADEAEAWMKENAPWQDRPRKKRKRWENPGARAGLRVWVGDEPRTRKGRREAQLYRESLDLRDEQSLQMINELRLSRGQQPRKTLPGQFSAVRAEKLKARNLPPIVRLEFTHRQDLRYAIWLEVGMGGRFSIIAPAIDRYGPKLMRDLQSIANLPLGVSMDKIEQSDYKVNYMNDAEMESWSEDVARRRAEGRSWRRTLKEASLSTSTYETPLGTRRREGGRRRRTTAQPLPRSKTKRGTRKRTD